MLQIFHVGLQVIDLYKNEVDENQIDLDLVVTLLKENHKFY